MGVTKLDGAPPTARRVVPAEQRSATVGAGTDPDECLEAPVVDVRAVQNDAGAAAARYGTQKSTVAHRGPRACSAP